MKLKRLRLGKMEMAIKESGINFRKTISYSEESRRVTVVKGTDSIRLLTRDAALAERVSRAFNHVIKLCGGGSRKEPF